MKNIKKLVALLATATLSATMCAFPAIAGSIVDRFTERFGGEVPEQALDFVNQFNNVDFAQDEKGNYYFNDYFNNDTNNSKEHDAYNNYTNSDLTSDALLGDVNHDGFIDARDATMIAMFYAYLSVEPTDDFQFTDEEKENFYKYGDVFKDGYVDALDASWIVIAYAALATQ